MAGGTKSPVVNASKIVCKHCDKVVVNYVKCIKCDQFYHPSCLVQSAQSKSKNCRHEVQEVDKESLKVMENETASNVLEVENNLLKRIIKEMESKYDILAENCELLKGKIDYLNEKIENSRHVQRPIEAPPAAHPTHAFPSRSKKNSNEVLYSSSQVAQKSPAQRETSNTSSYATIITNGSEDRNKSLKTPKSTPISGSTDVSLASGTRPNPKVTVSEQTKSKNNHFQVNDVNNAILNAQASNALQYYQNLGDVDQSQPQYNWEIAKPKRRKRFVVGGNDTNKDIQTIPKYTSLHVTRLEPSTKPEQLEAFLRDLFPGVSCEKLESKHPETYASLKVNIKQDHFKQAWKREVWPEGALVSRFFFKKRMPTQTTTS